MRTAWWTAMVVVVGCSPSAPTTAPEPAAEPASEAAAEATDKAAAAAPETAAAPSREQPFVRRAFEPTRNGQPLLDGIAYGPFREGQKPGGPNPTAEQILEDLKLLAPRFGMIRMYAAGEPTETVLQTIRDHDLPLVMQLGAWIAPDEASNQREVAEAIRLAKAYPEQVVAVAVGNESQVDWSAHRSDRAGLIEALRAVRAGVSQPVTTCDDYNFWNKPEALEVAAEIDYLCLHAYAMWNGKSLDEAVSWTDATYDDIAGRHPEHTIVMGESGWATELNPEGNEIKYIKAPAGEAEQARFYKEYTAWAREKGVPYFYFEAFDEPWKGSDDPREVEKHWGLYRVDRTPKPVLAESK